MTELPTGMERRRAGCLRKLCVSIVSQGAGMRPGCHQGTGRSMTLEQVTAYAVETRDE